MRSYSIFFKTKPGSGSNGHTEFLQSIHMFLQSPQPPSLRAGISAALTPGLHQAAPTPGLSRDHPMAGIKLSATSVPSPVVPFPPRTMVILLAALLI